MCAGYLWNSTTQKLIPILPEELRSPIVTTSLVVHKGPDPEQALLQAGPPDAVQPPPTAEGTLWCLVAADAENAQKNCSQNLAFMHAMTRSTLGISEPHSRTTSGVQATRSLSGTTRAWLGVGHEITESITRTTILPTLQRRRIAVLRSVVMACFPIHKPTKMAASQPRDGGKSCYTPDWALESPACICKALLL